MVSGYCCRCKVQVEITKGVMGSTSKGVPILKGVCAKCGCTVCRIGGK